MHGIASGIEHTGRYHDHETQCQPLQLFGCVLCALECPAAHCQLPVQALRVLRAIKPLRALTRSAGMQLIFKSLTLSLAAMGNVSIVVLLFFIIFAILGVQVGVGVGVHTMQSYLKCVRCGLIAVLLG